MFSKRGYTRGILHGLSDIPRWRQKFSARSSSTPPHPKHMLNLMNFMGKMAASQSSLKCHRLCPLLPLPHALQTRRNNLLETPCRKRFVTALPGQRKWRNALPTRRKSSDSHYRVLQERLSVLFLLFCFFFFFLSSSVAILYIRISSSLVSHCLSRWMHVRLKKDNKMSMKRISKAIKSKLTESIAKLVFFFFIKKYTLCR